MSARRLYSGLDPGLEVQLTELVEYQPLQGLCAPVTSMQLLAPH